MDPKTKIKNPEKLTCSLAYLIIIKYFKFTNTLKVSFLPKNFWVCNNCQFLYYFVKFKF